MRRLALAILCSGCGLLMFDHSRHYPYLYSDIHDVQALGCARVHPQPVFTTKTGVGITLLIDGVADPCTFELTSAELVLGKARASGETMPPPANLSFGSRVTAYVPFLLDVQREWNDDVREATLTLRTRDGASATFTLHFEGGR